MSEEENKTRLQVEAPEDKQSLEDWFLGTDEPEVYIDFQCIECGCIDPVPEFIIGEFSVDLKKGEEVEMHCPECDGTMRKKK